MRSKFTLSSDSEAEENVVQTSERIFHRQRAAAMERLGTGYLQVWLYMVRHYPLNLSKCSIYIRWVPCLSDTLPCLLPAATNITFWSRRAPSVPAARHYISQQIDNPISTAAVVSNLKHDCLPKMQLKETFPPFPNSAKWPNFTPGYINRTCYSSSMGNGVNKVLQWTKSSSYRLNPGSVKWKLQPYAKGYFTQSILKEIKAMSWLHLGSLGSEIYS